VLLSRIFNVPRFPSRHPKTVWFKLDALRILRSLHIGVTPDTTAQLHTPVQLSSLLTREELTRCRCRTAKIDGSRTGVIMHSHLRPASGPLTSRSAVDLRPSALQPLLPHIVTAPSHNQIGHLRPCLSPFYVELSCSAFSLALSCRRQSCCILRQQHPLQRPCICCSFLQ
jgi:hypothetical protein